MAGILKRITIAIILIIAIWLLFWFNRQPKIEMPIPDPIINNPILGATKIVDGKLEKLTLYNAKTPEEYKIRKKELVDVWNNTYKTKQKEILILGAAGEVLTMETAQEFISMVNQEIKVCPITNVGSVDGVQDYSSGNAYSVSPSVDVARIGGLTSGNFDGRISDVRIYDRALSVAEIQSLYQSYR